MSSDRSARTSEPACDGSAPPNARSRGAIMRGATEEWRPSGRAVTWSLGAMPAAALAGMAAATTSCALTAASALLTLGWLVDRDRDGDRAWRIACARLRPFIAAIGSAASAGLAAWALWCLLRAPQGHVSVLPPVGAAVLSAGTAVALWHDVHRSDRSGPGSPWPWPLAAWVASAAAVVALAFQRAHLVTAAPALLTVVLALLLWRLSHAWQHALSHSSEDD